MTIDPTPVVVSVIGFLGVLIGQFVSYKTAKRDREIGISESKAEQARKDQKLYDRLDHIDEKLDAHNKKLDRHNGFEGRIITLETLVAHLDRRVEKDDSTNSGA